MERVFSNYFFEMNLYSAKLGRKPKELNTQCETNSLVMFY